MSFGESRISDFRKIWTSPYSISHINLIVAPVLFPEVVNPKN